MTVQSYNLLLSTLVVLLLLALCKYVILRWLLITSLTSVIVLFDGESLSILSRYYATISSKHLIAVPHELSFTKFLVSLREKLPIGTTNWLRGTSRKFFLQSQVGFFFISSTFLLLHTTKFPLLGQKHYKRRYATIYTTVQPLAARI